MSETSLSKVRQYPVSSQLLEPLWFRSRESFSKNGAVYDPIAASVCRTCEFVSQCSLERLNEKQRLYVTLTNIIDRHVTQFLSRYPDAVILNVSAGLDTRFYRVDNGRCHWFEVDISEHLILRQKLFHANERYTNVTGSCDDLSWLSALNIHDQTPLLILCEHALLEKDEQALSRFIRCVGLTFSHAHLCMVLAGDLCDTKLGQKMGSESYQHGLRDPQTALYNVLPWAQDIQILSPLTQPCFYMQWWGKCMQYLPLKLRLTPFVATLNW
jgi:O-methyltransferase involved in polyketide biosynthesis